MNEKDSWFGVELRHLAALRALAREGSFRAAADSLGYAQSSVSQQIVQLERLVGARLVDRTRGSKRIRMTARGELLVEHAGAILARVKAARADFTAHADGGRTLSVGVAPGVGTRVLPDVLKAVAASAPDLTVRPVEAPSETALLELVEKGFVDAAFGEAPPSTEPLASRTIARDRCVLLVPAGSQWSRGPAPETLAKTPLVVLDGAASTAALEMWFAAHGLVPNVAVHAGNEASLRAFVAAGLGVAIVPRLAAEPWDTRVLAIDLDGIVPEREVAVYWHAERVQGEALELFVDVAARTVRSVVQTPMDDRAATRPPTVAVPVRAALARAGAAPAREAPAAPDDAARDPARDAA